MLHTCKLCAASLVTFYTKGHFHCPSLLGTGHTHTRALVRKPCDQDWQGGCVARVMCSAPQLPSLALEYLHVPFSGLFIQSPLTLVEVP